MKPPLQIFTRFAAAVAVLFWSSASSAQTSRYDALINAPFEKDYPTPPTPA